MSMEGVPAREPAYSNVTGAAGAGAGAAGAAPGVVTTPGTVMAPPVTVTVG
jgi:hypothetical protein